MLEEISDWDSMNSVNFGMELESSFGIDLSDVVFLLRIIKYRMLFQH